MTLLVAIKEIYYFKWWLVAELFHGTIHYSTAHKHKLHELEEQHNQVKEAHKQTEKELLTEKTYHEETRLQLQSTRSVQERTQQELEGRIDMWIK